MNRKPAVKVPEVCGIDLDYRPRDYFWAARLKIPLLSGIAGETRRQLVRELVEAGRSVPDGLDAAVLDEETRQIWGRLHPSNMGGEYLAPLRRGEVEIARISLQSVTADQITVRARRSGRRIATASSTNIPSFGRTSVIPQVRSRRFLWVSRRFAVRSA